MGADEVHAQCEAARTELRAAETSNVPATLVAVAICVTKCMEAIAGAGGGGGASTSGSTASDAHKAGTHK